MESYQVVRSSFYAFRTGINIGRSGNSVEIGELLINTLRQSDHVFQCLVFMFCVGAPHQNPFSFKLSTVGKRRPNLDSAIGWYDG